MKQRQHLLALMIAGLLFFSGCLHRRMGVNITYAMTEHVFGKTMDIPFWTNVFRENKRRMPHDYAELANYVSNYTNKQVQLAPYDHVDFVELPSGQRRAVCYSVSGSGTNKSVMTWGKPKP